MFGVAELNGDRESANFYYAKAKEADNHERHVTLASRAEDEGKKLVEVADNPQGLSCHHRTSAITLVAPTCSIAPQSPP